MLLPLLLLACQPEYATLDSEPEAADDSEAIDDSETTDDSDDSDAPTDTWTLGDPIRMVGAGGADTLVEWMDAEVVDENTGVVVGLGDIALVDLTDGYFHWRIEGEVAFRVAVDGRRVWCGTRSGDVLWLDLDEGSPPPLNRVSMRGRPHEDVAADGGRALIAVPDRGALLLDSQGREQAWLSANRATAVALSGDRALVGDAGELVLWDISNPSVPVELQRERLGWYIADLDLEGDRVAAGMGGDGVQLLELRDGALHRTGEVQLPGTAQSVALDGDHLWVGAWKQTVLVYLGEETPRVLGHHPPLNSAMGLGAGHGRALVADWQFATVLEAVPGLAGPEVALQGGLSFSAERTLTQDFRVTNWGGLPLEFQLGSHRDFSVSAHELLLAPGESEVLRIESLRAGASASLAWTSNDPDEPDGRLTLYPDAKGVGAEHEDFDLPGFVPPEQGVSRYRLSDQRGQVVLMAYFTTW